jgi:hypothetical protein
MLSSIVKQHTADQVESKKENGALQTNVPHMIQSDVLTVSPPWYSAKTMSELRSFVHHWLLLRCPHTSACRHSGGSVAAGVPVIAAAPESGDKC